MTITMRAVLNGGILSVGLAAATASAATLPVPGTYPTIQSAIDAASAGDEVVVSPGTYIENIDLKGKAITVRSTGGADVTAIDGNQLGSVVTMNSGEGPDTLLIGFTITNGLAPSAGGGIHCAASSPIIRECVIENNTARLGAGVYLDDSSAQLQECTVRSNSAGSALDPNSKGGGVYSSLPSALLSACAIEDNESFRFGGGVYGAGEIAECTITGNRASYGGGVYAHQLFGLLSLDSCDVSQNATTSLASNFAGGGVWGPAELRHCRVSENEAFDYGGGVYGAATLFDCVLSGNSVSLLVSMAASGGGAYGAILVRCRVEGNQALGSASFPGQGGGLTGGLASDCVIVGNSAEIGGGAHGTQLFRCTLTGNTAGVAGGGYFGSGENTIVSSILWGDAPQEIASSFGAPVVVYSDVQGGWPGTGNLNIDPQFIDPAGFDLRLPFGSPVIDLGEPTYGGHPNEPYDQLGFGHPRLMDGDFDGTIRVDMGAVEFGGLITPASPAVGDNLTVTLSGPSNGNYLLWLGVPTDPIVLGPQATLFLDPAFLFPLVGGQLPGSGTATILSVVVPPAAAGLEFHLQAGTKVLGGGGILRLTNLETVSILP